MTRYIDADALIKKIYPMGICDGKYTINAKAVKLAIDNTPTADVVEVIRCKDCAYFNGEICSCHSDYYGEHEVQVEADDYCSYGRREW